MRTPFGGLRIRTEIVDASLMITQVQYLSDLDKASRPLNELAKDAKQQIENYFDDPHFLFDLPIKTQGSTFQQRVWSTIESIPVGQTMTMASWPIRSNQVLEPLAGLVPRTTIH